MLLKQKDPLQFSSMLYPILHWWLKYSHNSYRARAPKKQKRWLSAGEQEPHTVWSELHGSKYFGKVNPKPARTVLVYIHSTSQLSRSPKWSTAWEHTPTHSSIPPRQQAKVYCWLYRPRIFSHWQHLVPPSMHQVVFHQQLWTLPFLGRFWGTNHCFCGLVGHTACHGNTLKLQAGHLRSMNYLYIIQRQ